MRAQLPRPFRWPALWLLLASSASLGQPVDLSLRLKLDLGSDSNPFQAPNGATLAASSSDAAGATRFQQQTVEAAVGIPLGSEFTQCILSGSVSARQHQPLDLLDHRAGQAQARCPWQWTPLWAGELLARRTHEPTPFWDGTYRQLAMRDEQLLSGTVTLKATPDSDFPLSVQSRRLRHQDPAANAQFDVNDTRARLGWIWHPATSSVLKLDTEWVQADYPTRTAAEVQTLDSRWTERRAGAEVQWRYSALTSLGGRLGLAQRDYAHLSGRNFSTGEGAFNLSFRPSALHQVAIQMARSTQDSYQTDALYTIARSQTITWTWEPGSHDRLQLAYAQSHASAAGLESGADNSSTQRTRRFSARFKHDLGSGLDLQMGFQHHRDSHSDLTGDIVERIWQVGLSYRFENLTGARKRSGLADDF